MITFEASGGGSEVFTGNGAGHVCGEGNEDCASYTPVCETGWLVHESLECGLASGRGYSDCTGDG